MKYPELAAIDSTPDQDLALALAFKDATSAPHAPAIVAQTTGEFLAAVVLQHLESWTERLVTQVKVARVEAAIRVAVTAQDAKTLSDIAAAAKVDLTIAPPA